VSATSGPAAVLAAGALVWRVRAGRLQVVLVHRPRYQDWSWPKGKLDPGESLAGTAIREVSEETGHDIVLGLPLPTLEYSMPDGRTKRVSYWAAQVARRPDAAAVRARPPFVRASTDEIDRTRWFDADAAASRLTNSDDREPLAVLVDAYARGRLDTRALVIARHGRARKRAAWPGTELDRPLTPVGARQATAMTSLLSAFGVTHVVTSGWARCRSTIEPYAQAAHVTAVEVAHLTESEHKSSPARVAAVIAGLIADGRNAVVCTHRPVLPTVLDVLAQHSLRRVADALPVRDPFLRPGAVLVAHIAASDKGPRVVAVEMHQPTVL